MKLLACQVENFGKLSDYSVVFSEGLNTIIEDNGWGKTTLAAFLKAMLYGLDPKKEPGAYDKERVMYRPWQGGTYGGTLDFEVGTKSYRVSRTFGRTEKADEFRLYDLATMLESRDYSASLGTEIFDLDSTSFKRSVFIGQSDCAFMPTDSISAKLGNLAENTNDINNYESAYGNIKDALNRLTPNRATGSIRRRQQLMAQLDAEISSLDAAQDGYSRIRVMRKEKIDEKEALSAQREGLAQALKDASEKSAVLEKRASYNALLAEEQQAADNCKKYEEKFPAGVPTEEDLRKFTGTVRQMAEVEATIRNLCSEDADAQEYERLRERFGDTPPDKETVDSYIEKNRAYSVNEDRIAELKKEQEEQRRQFEEDPIGDRPGDKVRITVGTVLGIVFVVIAAVMLVGSFGAQSIFPEFELIRYVPAVGMIATGVSFLIAALLFGMGNRQKSIKRERLDAENAVWDSRKAMRDAQENELSEQIKDLEFEQANLEQDIREFLEQCHMEDWKDRFVSAMYELSNDVDRYWRLSHTYETQEKAHQARALLLEQVDEFADRYRIEISDDIAAELADIQAQAAQYTLAKQSYDRAIWKRNQFEAANDMEQILAEDLGGESIEEINAQIREADASIEEARAAIEQYSRQMDDLQQRIDLREERQEELGRSQALQAEELHRYDILQCTQGYLQRAKERFTSRYMEPISQAFCRYYDMLLPGKYNQWQIDANISFSVSEQGQMRQVHTLSAGYRDLIGICMRFALIDVMYEGEKPFLILDDSFVNLDNDKQAAGMKLLSSVAEDYQVIYFTCHTSRVPAEKQSEA